MKKLGLLPRLIIGITLGIIVGLIMNKTQSNIVTKMLGAVIGTYTSLFGNLLKFTVPLIILGLITPGIADLGKKAGKMLTFTTALAYISSIIAGFFAYGVGKILIPMLLHGIDARKLTGEIKTETIFNSVVPLDLGQIMGAMTAIALAFVIGLGLAYSKEETLKNIVFEFKDIVEKFLNKVIIPFIPFHIAGLFAKLAGDGAIVPVIQVFSVLFAMLIVLQILCILAQYTVACIYGKKPYFKSIKNMLPAYLTAIGTQSSAATIPVTLEATGKNGISDDVKDFVIPLCANIHLAGDMITLTLGAMGILYLFSPVGETIQLALGIQYVLLLGVAMVAAPGIPGGGVMTALGLLGSLLGMTSPQQALMIALHFSQDSFGTATNVTGDGAIAIIVDERNKRISN
ncbi:MAG: cation:dicarboxylase symporter family transporter [Leptotrichiaceae bacterium]